MELETCMQKHCVEACDNGYASLPLHAPFDGRRRRWRQSNLVAKRELIVNVYSRAVRDCEGQSDDTTRLFDVYSDEDKWSMYGGGGQNKSKWSRMHPRRWH